MNRALRSVRIPDCDFGAFRHVFLAFFDRDNVLACWQLRCEPSGRALSYTKLSFGKTGDSAASTRYTRAAVGFPFSS